MKTTKDIILEYVHNNPKNYGQNKGGLKEYITLEWEELEEMLLNYGYLVIEEDRKDIIKNVKVTSDTVLDYKRDLSHYIKWRVDINSILNTPYPELK